MNEIIYVIHFQYLYKVRRPHTIPVFVTVAFALGVISGFYFKMEPPISYVFLIGIPVCFVFTFIRARLQFFQDWGIVISSFSMLFLLGFLNTALHQPERQPYHYGQLEMEKPAVFVLKIRQHLKSSWFQHNYVARVERIDGRYTEGNVLLSLAKDSLTPPLLIDDRIALKT